MTKQQELDALKHLALTLGADSYLGPALLDALPSIEQDMRSDVPPVPWASVRTAILEHRALQDKITVQQQELKRLHAQREESLRELKHLQRQAEEISVLARNIQDFSGKVGRVLT